MKSILSSEKLDNLIILNKLNNEKIDWYEICEKYQLEENSIKEYCNDIFNFVIDKGLNRIEDVFVKTLQYINFNSNIVKELKSFVLLNMITEPALKKLVEYTNYDKEFIRRICTWQKISEEFMEEYLEVIDWDGISRFQELSTSFMEKHLDKLNWYSISKYQFLSEDFIEKYSNRINWDNLSLNELIPEHTLFKFSDKLNWNTISKYQDLSESFIEKYQDKVNWEWISKHQILSERFIEKHKDKVDWDYIFDYQMLSNDFVEKYKIK